MVVQLVCDFFSRKKKLQRPVCPSGSSGLFRGKEGEAKRATGVVTRSKKRSRTARQIFLVTQNLFVDKERREKKSGWYIYIHYAFGLGMKFFGVDDVFPFFFGKFLPKVGHAQVDVLNLRSEHPKCWISKYEHSCHAKSIFLFGLGRLSRSSNCRCFHNSPPATFTCMLKKDNEKIPRCTTCNSIFLRLFCGGGGGGDARLHPEHGTCSISYPHCNSSTGCSA